MKKVLPFILGFVLVIVLATWNDDFVPDIWSLPSGTESTSGSTAVPTAPPATPSATNPADPSDPGSDKPAISFVQELSTSAIALSQQTEFSRTDNGVVYFSYTYPNVRLYLTDDSVSESVTLDLLNRIEATRTRADAIREDASQAENVTYFYNITYSPERIDSGVLSISAVTTSFSGAAHPYSTCAGITYDLLSGNALGLNDLLTDRCTPDVLCSLVVQALQEINTDGLLYSDFSLSVEDRFSGNYLADDGWYLSAEGLCFLFEPYEVGPYSSGIITAQIPYSKLTGYLEDAWFPAEQVNSAGSLTITPATESTLEGFTNLVEVNLDPDGEAYVIFTDGLVYDLTIRTTGTNGTILFAADRMTPGTAIILRTASPNSLRISYTSDETVFTQSCNPT